jgi:hypothetical protein
MNMKTNFFFSVPVEIRVLTAETYSSENIGANSILLTIK